MLGHRRVADEVQRRGGRKGSGDRRRDQREGGNEGLHVRPGRWWRVETEGRKERRVVGRTRSVMVLIYMLQDSALVL